MNRKPPKPTPLEKRVEAIHQRLCEVENIAHADLFKDAIAQLYDANMQLMQCIQQIKRLKTPWWKKFAWQKKTIK